jgi:Avidin family
MEGVWYNQRDRSKLEILPVAAGIITGLYEIPAGTAGCPKGRFPVQGRTDVGRDGSTFGFAVNWQNAESSCDSTTAWAGQYTDVGGVETLTAYWVLVTASTHESGEDHFKRTP